MSESVAMPIHIEHVPGGLLATVTPSKYSSVSWSADEPMARRELIDKLTELGFHLQDIADALHFADLEQTDTH
jgi:hypothetical protein